MISSFFSFMRTDRQTERETDRQIDRQTVEKQHRDDNTAEMYTIQR